MKLSTNFKIPLRHIPFLFIWMDFLYKSITALEHYYFWDYICAFPYDGGRPNKMLLIRCREDYYEYTPLIT